MIAPACRHEQVKKQGHDRNGNQRFRCTVCGKTWTERKPKPIGDMRIEKHKAVLALRLLLEGNSIRSTERIVGINRNTIMRLLEVVGERALRYWDYKMVGLHVENVEVDEIWGFVGCKEKTNNRLQKGVHYGDCYCFTAFERDSKLMVAWRIGKRTPQHTAKFAKLLHRVTANRFQLSTDGFSPYSTIIPDAFDDQVDFAQLVKIFFTPPGKPGRYSPPEIREIHSKVVCGNPNQDLICTSHVERQNLNIRMGVRRMTRLTNAFSKKWENHRYALAIYFLYYNFCRVHQTLKTTPAVKHGMTDAVWSVERMLDELTEN